MSTPVMLLRDNPHVDWEGDTVEFRLIYEGPLLSETLRDGAVRRARAEHKHIARKRFHEQLKYFWNISPYLRPRELPQSSLPGSRILGRPSPQHTIESLSRNYSMFGYNFVPLVTRNLELLCAVEILFLRRGIPGDVPTRTGDIDNRLKTLFDALSIPRTADQLGPFTTPEEGEIPFFCLLEDDSVITKASVESDVLLKTISDPPDPNDSHVVITVRIRPGRLNADNVGFA